MKTIIAAALAAGALFIIPSKNHAADRGAFVFAQIRYEGDWDPYPGMWEEIISFLTTTTSVEAAKERKILAISEEIFDCPAVWLFGKNDFPALKKSEIAALRSFFDRGGMLFIDDSTDAADSRFRRRIREEFAKIFPEKKWERIPESHAIFRSFYLLRGVAGRNLTRDYLEGISYGGRFSVVFSPNDTGGAWQKDRFGNYLYECLPNREKQRWESHKLTVNFILYSLTGTYKSDAVHKPYIEQKLRR